MEYPHDLESKELNVILEYSKEDSVEGLGYRMWQKDWHEKKIISKYII